MAATTTRPARTRDDRLNTRNKVPAARPEIWTSLLRRTAESQARSRTQLTQHRSLLILGGAAEDQQAFVQSLARPAPAAPVSSNRTRDAGKGAAVTELNRAKGEVRLSCGHALGYGVFGLFSPGREGAGYGLGLGESEEVGRVEVHTLSEPEAVYVNVLRRLLLPQSPRKEGAAGDAGEVETDDGDACRPTITILLSWTQPWTFLRTLQRWLLLIASALSPSDKPTSDSPLELLTSSALTLIVIIQHVEAQIPLEREDYRDETFDHIAQTLRTCLLPFSAAIVYTSSTPPPQQPGGPLSEVQKVLYTSLDLDLASLSPAPARNISAVSATVVTTKKDDLSVRHNVVDRMALVVPRGWDSAGKIRLPAEGFSPEAVLDAWKEDLDDLTPLDSVALMQGHEAAAESSPQQEPQADAGAVGQATVVTSSQQPEQDVYATSPIDPSDDDETALPQQAQRSAIAAYELTILDPLAHKIQPPPQIEVETKPHQQFLAEMRAHLLSLEASESKDGSTSSSTSGTSTNGRGPATAGAAPSTAALDELGDVSINVGGVSYNATTAGEAIERLKTRAAQPPSSPGADASPLAAGARRDVTPRQPRREDREASGTPQPPSSKGDGGLDVDKLDAYFKSLMKKGGGSSGASTPSKG